MMNRDTGSWELPQPLDIKEENEWQPIPRIARTIPFGYNIDPDNEHILRPIPRELDALEKAKKHLKQYSYREVANWLTKQTGRYISHVGLRKRLQDEQKRKNKARSLRKWAEYAEKAISKAKEIEETRTGAKAYAN